MNTYEVEVVVRYKFTVTAHDPYEAYREAQEWDEYFTESEVQSMTIAPVCSVTTVTKEMIDKGLTVGHTVINK